MIKPFYQCQEQNALHVPFLIRTHVQGTICIWLIFDIDIRGCQNKLAIGAFHRLFWKLRRLLQVLVGQFWARYWRNKMEIAAYFFNGTSYSETYWQPWIVLSTFWTTGARSVSYYSLWMGCWCIAGLHKYVCRYSFVHLCKERHCDGKVSCPRTHYMVTLARAWVQITFSHHSALVSHSYYCTFSWLKKPHSKCPGNINQCLHVILTCSF